MTPPNQNQPPRAAFDHEKLHAYQMEVRFLTWVSRIIDEAKSSAHSKGREVCDQLDRASLSVLLNTAEGNGKRRGQVRAKYFDDARGSATECAACLDAMVAKGIIPPESILEGKAMLIQIVSMLCGLVDRFDQPDCRCHEDAVEYRIAELPETAERKRTRKRTI